MAKSKGTREPEPAVYFATVGIECEDWRCELGDELIGYPAALDIKGLKAAGAITTSVTPEGVEAVDG
jgi:hypothetical protein